MSENGVIPRPEDRLKSRPALTDWHVEGEIQCPDCGSHFAVDCPLEDVQRFTVSHEQECEGIP